MPHGHLNPGERKGIPFIFRPLEALTYSVELPIHVIGGQTHVIRFDGEGYHPYHPPRDRLCPTPYDGGVGGSKELVPCKQRIPLPGQVFFLSMDRLELGDVPMFAEVRRVVVCSNRSPTNTMSFTWRYTDPLTKEVLSVSPSYGVLEPGESCVCRVSFFASRRVHIYDVDVECEVVDLSEMKEHERQCDEVNKQREAKLNAISITDKAGHRDKNLSPLPGISRSNTGNSRANLTATSGAMGGQSAALSFPSLSRSGSFMRSNSQQGGAGANAKMAPALDVIKRELPLPPAPPAKVVYLGVCARSHPTQDYARDFADRFPCYWVDRVNTGGSLGTALLERAMPNLSLDDVNPRAVSVAVEVGKLLLQDVLRDVSFRDAVKALSEAPVPYFMQLGKEETSEEEAGTATLTAAKKAASDEDSAASVAPTTAEANVDSKDEGSEGKQGEAQSAHEKSFVGADAVPGVALLDAVPAGLLRVAEFQDVAESILENTIFNLVAEANWGDYSLTAKPRVVIESSAAQVPKTPRGNRWETIWDHSVWDYTPPVEPTEEMMLFAKGESGRATTASTNATGRKAEGVEAPAEGDSAPGSASGGGPRAGVPVKTAGASTVSTPAAFSRSGTQNTLFKSDGADGSSQMVGGGAVMAQLAGVLQNEAPVSRQSPMLRQDSAAIPLTGVQESGGDAGSAE